MVNGLFIICGFILLVALLYFEKKKKQRIFLITKSTLSILFVMAAFLQPHVFPEYYPYLIAGLILGLVGDVCLALPQEKMFMIGLGAFFIGHVFYILGFSALAPFAQWISGGMAIIALISAAIFFWLRPHLKPMLVPVLLYIIVISIMAWGAWVVFWKTSFHPFGRALIWIGAICFYLSDLFVARNKFIREEYWNQLIGLPLYYIGQYSLAFSVGLLK